MDGEAAEGIKLHSAGYAPPEVGGAYAAYPDHAEYAGYAGRSAIKYSHQPDSDAYGTVD